MSDTRIGVPFFVAIEMFLNSSAASIRPSVRSRICPFPCSTTPPGTSMFSDGDGLADLRHRQPVRVQLLEVDDDVDLARAPAADRDVADAVDRLDAPAPSACPRARSGVRRLMSCDDTMSVMTGAASGSTLVMTGGRSSGGTLLIALATFSRTSLAASLISRSSTKRTVIWARALADARRHLVDPGHAADGVLHRLDHGGRDLVGTGARQRQRSR